MHLFFFISYGNTNDSKSHRDSFRLIHDGGSPNAIFTRKDIRSIAQRHSAEPLRRNFAAPRDFDRWLVIARYAIIGFICIYNSARFDFCGFSDSSQRSAAPADSRIRERATVDARIRESSCKLKCIERANSQICGSRTLERGANALIIRSASAATLYFAVVTLARYYENCY